MNITEFDIYLLTRLDYVHGFAMGLGCVAIFCTIMLLIVGWAELEPKMRNIAFKRFMPLGILLVVAGILIPTTKEYAAIKLIPLVANSEDAQDLGSEFVDLGHAWLEELKPETDKE